MLFRPCLKLIATPSGSGKSKLTQPRCVEISRSQDPAARQAECFKVLPQGRFRHAVPFQHAKSHRYHLISYAGTDIYIYNIYIYIYMSMA